MKQVAVQNKSRPAKTPVIAAYCSSFFSRLRGFTFRRSIPLDRGLILVQSRDNRVDSSIHMLFVFTDLAVVWINNAGEVVDACLAKRWRLFYAPKRPARYVLEMNPARLGDYQLGDCVSFEQVWLD